MTRVQWPAAVARHLLRLSPFQNGTARLTDLIPALRPPLPSRRVDVRVAGGSVMAVDPGDLVGHRLYLLGSFDLSVAAVLLAVARRGDVIWDIGANIGFVGCYLARRIPDSKVVAVEPLPSVFALTETNIRCAAGDRGLAVRAAISDRTGRAMMSIQPGNTGASHITGSAEQPGEASPTAGPEVEMITAVDLLGRTPWPGVDLVKIDVEGHERNVFRALEGLPEKVRPRAVVFEHHVRESWIAPEIAGICRRMGWTVGRVAKGMMGTRVLGEGEGVRFGYVASADWVAVRSELASRVFGRRLSLRPPR